METEQHPPPRVKGKERIMEKQYQVTIEEKNYIKFSIDISDIQDLEETARCRAIGLGYDPDDIVNIIEETPVREEGEIV